MSGAARSRIHRNEACRSGTLVLRACQSPTKIGNWIRAGKQPPTGLTPCFLYSANVSLVCFSLSSLYFS